MAQVIQYVQAGGSFTGCPGTALQAGWYDPNTGSLISTLPQVNPATGNVYTPGELTGDVGAGETVPAVGGAVTVGPTEYTPPTLKEGVGPGGMTYQEYLAQAPEGMIEADVEAHWLKIVGEPQHVGETRPEIGPGAIAEEAPVPMPTFDPGAISVPPVTPVPPYEISPEQQELMETLGTQITDWVTSGGYGLPPEVQAQMIQQQTDTLKAREQEAIRVMRNNMERRGITNSGFMQASENMITSNTTLAIAGAIADVQIKSALMKMASFEKAMGAAAQFLGYLSEQSQLAYAPKFQTWQAEQLAKMQAWQASFDVYKMAINQAYQQQNMTLQADLTQGLQDDQQAFDLELAEMELEAQQQAAAAEGAGQLIGSASGLVGSLIAGS